MRCPPLLPVLVCVLLLTAGCGQGQSEQEIERSEAEATLAAAPEAIQERVRQRCERWRDTAGECEPDRVYADVLKCWTEKGPLNLRASIKVGMRPRATNRRVVLQHSLCMEQRGWRLRPGTGGYF